MLHTIKTLGLAGGLLVAACLTTGCARDGEAYIAAKPAVELNNHASELVATDPQQAITLLDEALVIDPDYPLAMGNRASALGRLGRYEEAAAQLGALRARHPDMLRSALGQGIYLERAGQAEQGRVLYQQAIDGLTEKIKRKPADATLYCQRAFGYFLLGDNEQAGRSLDAIERQFPDNREVLAMRRLMLQRKRDEVVATYGGVIPIQTKKPGAASAGEGKAAE